MAAALQTRLEQERRFAADVSHELRTPLTSLTAAIRIVERRADGLDDGGREAVAVLEGQLQHFSRLVLEILELSRLEAGTADVRAELVELRPMLEGLVADVGLGHELLVLRGDLPDHVTVDPRRLRVVLRNLVDNAAHYAGGCTRVVVRADAERWYLDVDDAGPGVPLQEREHIFERFHRGSGRQRSDGDRGTGLGLALVDESVRAMGGTVEVGDAPGGGARFTVGLPRRVDVAAGVEVPALLQGPPASAPSAPGGSSS
jgi:signal transduction histidine kinase